MHPLKDRLPFYTSDKFIVCREMNFLTTSGGELNPKTLRITWDYNPGGGGGKDEK